MHLCISYVNACVYVSMYCACIYIYTVLYMRISVQLNVCRSPCNFREKFIRYWLFEICTGDYWAIQYRCRQSIPIILSKVACSLSICPAYLLTIYLQNISYIVMSMNIDFYVIYLDSSFYAAFILLAITRFQLSLIVKLLIISFWLNFNCTIIRSN